MNKAQRWARVEPGSNSELRCAEHQLMDVTMRILRPFCVKRYLISFLKSSRNLSLSLLLLMFCVFYFLILFYFLFFYPLSRYSTKVNSSRTCSSVSTVSLRWLHYSVLLKTPTSSVFNFLSPSAHSGGLTRKQTETTFNTREITHSGGLMQP